MFIHAVPDNRGKKDGYYCSLVESRRINSIPKHKTILSFGFITAERLPYLKAAFNRGDPETILEREKRSQEKTKGDPIIMSQHTDNKKPVVEYIAKITLPNGEVIEKSVSTVGDFPSLEEFDLSTREGFLEDFDHLEKAVLETSRKLNGEISREFLDASSKKKRNPQ